MALHVESFPVAPLGCNCSIVADLEAKVAIVRRVLSALSPQGLLYTGHSESLGNLGLPIRSIAPAVYVRA